jgi:hypothetical protein
MWQREQNASSKEPGRDTSNFLAPMSKDDAHRPGIANGLCGALGVWSGGAGVSHSPFVEVARASSRKAARQTGSRQEFDIIEPFHSSKMRW